MTSAQAVSLAYLACGLAMWAAAPLVWQRRATRGGTALFWLLVTTGWWSLCDVAEVHAGTVEARQLISQLQYLGVAPAPAFYMLMALQLSRKDRRLPAALQAALWAVPLASLLLAATNGWHQAIWARIELPPAAEGPGLYHYGPAFWPMVAVDYLYLAVGTASLVRAARRLGEPFRRPLLVLGLAGLLPWAGSVGYLTKRAPVAGFDWTVVGMAAMALVVAWTVLRQGLLDLVPVARQVAVDGIADGVVVVDAGGRVRYANPAARRLAGTGDQALAHLADAAREAGATAPLRLQGGGAPGLQARVVDVRCDPLQDAWGQPGGRLLRLTDVTERRARAAERQALLDDLTRAVAEVDTLRGLLPICPGCKKVRDDQGYWRALESYLATAAHLTFSHGICPDCLQRLYPEVEGS